MMNYSPVFGIAYTSLVANLANIRTHFSTLSLSRMRTTWITWQGRHGYRRQLRHMDEHLLKDIGLSKWKAAREIDKLFWEP